MRPKMETNNLCLRKIPVWVKLFNIPLEYWTECGLSSIASAIGKPLHADSDTESLRRISFARVCVEIDVDSLLTSSFGLKIADTVIDIFVQYAWNPLRCDHCKFFGHGTSNYRLNISRVAWRPIGRVFLTHPTMYHSVDPPSVMVWGNEKNSPFLSLVTPPGCSPDLQDSSVLPSSSLVIEYPASGVLEVGVQGVAGGSPILLHDSYVLPATSIGDLKTIPFSQVTEDPTGGDLEVGVQGVAGFSPRC
ncbi:DUF4283 domain-containing protein [Cephalotus follicularis]|uniref:DUF4283 domain-containing protein n=1 Tax=Cephalotus follicularis TaxID=3775 RepID=A0A1Q3C9Z9_CEPFO|nr:DUF4283 domain-containing protein [Cephalotus follicularis]